MKRDVDATVVGGATRHERAYWMFTVDEAHGSQARQPTRRAEHRAFPMSPTADLFAAAIWFEIEAQRDQLPAYQLVHAAAFPNGRGQEWAEVCFRVAAGACDSDPRHNEGKIILRLPRRDTEFVLISVEISL